VLTNVIHGMMHRRPRQHQAVQQCHAQTCLGAARERLKRPAAGRAVQVDLVADAHVNHGKNIRLAINRKADMANQAFIQDLVNRGAIVSCPLRFSFDCRPIGWWLNH